MEAAPTHYLESTAITNITAVFVGDSYTAGAGATNHSERWTDLVAAYQDWDEVNLGAGGTGYVNEPAEPEKACGRPSCPTYLQQAQQAVTINPQIVIVSGGRNDLTAVAHDPERVRSAINMVLDTLRLGLPDARIFVVAPFWDSSTPSGRVSELARWLKTAAGQYGADFIPDATEYLIGRDDAISRDGVHPNDLGYAIIAERLNMELVGVLKSQAANQGVPLATSTGSVSAPPTN